MKAKVKNYMRKRFRKRLAAVVNSTTVPDCRFIVQNLYGGIRPPRSDALTIAPDPVLYGSINTAAAWTGGVTNTAQLNGRCALRTICNLTDPALMYTALEYEFPSGTQVSDCPLNFQSIKSEIEIQNMGAQAAHVEIYLLRVRDDVPIMDEPSNVVSFILNTGSTQFDYSVPGWDDPIKAAGLGALDDDYVIKDFAGSVRSNGPVGGLGSARSALNAFTRETNPYRWKLFCQKYHIVERRVVKIPRNSVYKKNYLRMPRVSNAAKLYNGDFIKKDYRQNHHYSGDELVFVRVIPPRLPLQATATNPGITGTNFLLYYTVKQQLCYTPTLKNSIDSLQGEIVVLDSGGLSGTITQPLVKSGVSYWSQYNSGGVVNGYMDQCTGSRGNTQLPRMMAYTNAADAAAINTCLPT